MIRSPGTIRHCGVSGIIAAGAAAVNGVNIPGSIEPDNSRQRSVSRSRAIAKACDAINAIGVGRSVKVYCESRVWALKELLTQLEVLD